jgi:hypothetical protein
MDSLFARIAAGTKEAAGDGRIPAFPWNNSPEEAQAIKSSSKAVPQALCPTFFGFKFSHKTVWLALIFGFSSVSRKTLALLLDCCRGEVVAKVSALS